MDTTKIKLTGDFHNISYNEYANVVYDYLVWIGDIPDAEQQFIEELGEDVAKCYVAGMRFGPCIKKMRELLYQKKQLEDYGPEV